MKPLHEAFFDWLQQHQEKINQIVFPTLYVNHEYTPSPGDKHLLMDADIQLLFHLNGREVFIFVPVFASFSLNDGNLTLSTCIRDNYENENCYEHLLADQPQDETVDDLLNKIDEAFHQYFKVESDEVRSIQLLNSIKHEDLIPKLIELNKC